MYSSSHHGSGSTSHLDQKKITAKDLDHVLSEMTLLESRAEMYYKFVRKRVTVRIGPFYSPNPNADCASSDFRTTWKFQPQRLMPDPVLYPTWKD